MNIFLDTNVVIDFLGEREDFFAEASIIFSMIDEGTIHASVSALTIVNCAYILKKAFNADIMYDKVEALFKMLDVLPIDKSQLQNAIKIRPYDYEDAVQYYSALPTNPDVIITRDKKGYRDLDVLVMTPSEFVKRLKQ